MHDSQITLQAVSQIFKKMKQMFDQRFHHGFSLFSEKHLIHNYVLIPIMYSCELMEKIQC